MSYGGDNGDGVTLNVICNGDGDDWRKSKHYYYSVTMFVRNGNYGDDNEDGKNITPPFGEN